MRNYPLFKDKNKATTETNWQETYVGSLALQAKSLVDYSNYFLADFRRGPDLRELTNHTMWKNEERTSTYPCFSLQDLRYHQYIDSEEEGVYFLKDSDFDQDMVFDPTNTKYRLIRSGRHIVNNNQRETKKDTYADWENITIQPMGYAAFYLVNYIDKKLTFSFTKNAQLYYGNNSPIAILDFYTRFFYKNNTGYYQLSNFDLQFQSVDILSTKDGKGIIADKQGFTWTDREFNPVMGFTCLPAEEGYLGEEFIADSKITYTIRLDKVGVATYTMTSNGDLADGETLYWPNNSRVYFL